MRSSRPAGGRLAVRARSILWVDGSVGRRFRALLFVAAACFCHVVTAREDVHDFGTTPQVIDIGYGVLATPMSVIGEVMRRDRVLHEGGRRIGVEFRFHAFEKGVDTLPHLLEERLDASMPTDVVVLELIARSEIVLLGYVRQSFSSVIGPKALTMAGLKGKRIGNSRGTSGHSTLMQGLASAGLGEDDVVLVQMMVRDMPEALFAGRIDAFAAWEPTPSSTLKKFPGRYKALHRQISPAYFALSKKVADAQPEAARLLVASLHRAVRWLSGNRSHLAKASSLTLDAMRGFTGTPPDLRETDIVALTRSDLLDIAGAPLVPAGDAERGGGLWRSYDFLLKSGQLPNRLKWDKVKASVDRQLTAQVLGQPKRFRLDEFDYELR